MFFKQIQQHTDNFSYIIADENTKEAAIVDSSYNADEIIKVIKNEKLQLKYIINTHGHSDHTAGNIELQSIFGAKIVAHKQSKSYPDLVVVDEGDTLDVGKISLKIIYTPGHTVDSICLLVNNQKLLTGDTLFVGECGRTDFPGGNAKSMYESLNKLQKLNGNIEVYPGHDYGLMPSSTIEEEKKSNYTLQPRSLREFIEFMSQP
jgi:hydroxyacylglutathione hydrolase